MKSSLYYNPVRLAFGVGAFRRLGELARPLGRCALVVTGQSSARRQGILDRALQMLQDAGLQTHVFDSVPPNPTDDVAEAGGRMAREARCDLVIGLGGGSAMDTAKAIAVAATHDAPVSRFVMSDGSGVKLTPTAATLPIICVTTTAGTSSELTPFAVLITQQGREKNAIVGEHIYPRASICDPELTCSVPPRITAATGVDVLCHAVEGYINVTAWAFTDSAAEQAIRLVGEFLPRAVADGSDVRAREAMSLANVFAGVPLSNCGAGLMHALEHPISAHYPQVPHGEGLAALLVAYARECWQVMPDRFARVAELLGGPAQPQAAAAACEALLEATGMNVRLGALGVASEMLERLADDALRYMGRAVHKLPGPPDRELALRVLRASL